MLEFVGWVPDMVHLLITISLVVRSCSTGTFSLYIVSSLSFDINIIFLYHGKASQIHLPQCINNWWCAFQHPVITLNIKLLHISSCASLIYKLSPKNSYVIRSKLKLCYLVLRFFYLSTWEQKCIFITYLVIVWPHQEY